MPLTSNVLRGLPRTALAAVVLLGSITASYLSVTVWQTQRVSGVAVSEAGVASSSTPVNPFADVNGTHLIAFVFTSSDCGWSADQATMDAVGSIRSKMRSAHGGSYAEVSVVGVALDDDLEAGLRFLSELGNGTAEDAFDQVIVGGSWLNEQVVRFVWREHVAKAASPQVVVIERPVNTESYLLTSTIHVDSDRLVVNPVGSAEIIQWINQGLRLDYSPYRAEPQ